jgi:hypothetical protein
MDGGDGETVEGGSEDSIVFFLKKKSRVQESVP